LARTCVALVFGLTLAAVHSTFAQVTTINSVALQTNLVGGLPDATFTLVDDYPSLISFIYTNAGTTNTSFSAEQDAWSFAVNGSPYMFQTNDYYTATMQVTLTGDPSAPRKEAGIAFEDIDSSISGQFILDTDAGEIVAFGGNLPFYASPLTHTFKSGDTVTMSVTILKDSNGSNAIVYSANGISSPILEFNADSPYLANGTTPAPYTLGGYFQIQGQGTALTNSGSASFQNISIGPPLTIANAGVNANVVTWPASAPNYILQMTTNLASTNWTTVIGQPVTGLWIPNASSNVFYRLRQTQ
jgi:hypothetical protein